MKNENNQKTISEKVTSEIKKKGIKMKSRLYFVAKSFSFIGLIFLLFLFILYLGSLIIFVLRANNILYFQGMGFPAFKTIILSFPWYLVFLATVLIVFVEIISKRFQFVYRKPLAYSLLVVIIITLIGSFLVEKSSVHQYFYNFSQREKIPLVDKMYRNLGSLDIEDAYFGKVLDKKEGYLILELDSGEIVSLVISEKIRGHGIYLESEKGDNILVIGEMKNDTIDVFSFRRINGYFRINER